LFVSLAVFSLYVGLAILDFPKIANEGSFFWRLQRFSLSVSMRGRRFSPQDQHCSMLGWKGCSCGKMNRLNIFSHTATKKTKQEAKN
jgi:hypothetical protein